MKPKDPKPTPAPGPARGPDSADSTLGSGEGSKSALEALIRKRKEAPDDAEPATPAPPDT